MISIFYLGNKTYNCSLSFLETLYAFEMFTLSPKCWQTRLAQGEIKKEGTEEVLSSDKARTKRRKSN